MPPLQPRTFEHLPRCEALSPASLESHLRLYAGYVDKYNSLIEKLQSLQARGPAAIADIGSLKGDITYALGSIKNHELYFDSLGAGESAEPAGELLEALVKSFHSLPQYLVDLKQTALQGRGWAWTAFDHDQGTLFNYEAGAQNGLPVVGTSPLLAIDLYGHAYFYDFGNNKQTYVEAVMEGLDWAKVGQRLAAARKSQSR